MNLKENLNGKKKSPFIINHRIIRRMELSEIKQIALMARIKLTDDECQQYCDINNILELLVQINNIDTTTIEPLTHPIDVRQPLRQDNVTEINQRENYQAISPNIIKNGLYLVPNVFYSDGEKDAL